jgi:hypothetical protein
MARVPSRRVVLGETAGDGVLLEHRRAGRFERYLWRREQQREVLQKTYHYPAILLLIPCLPVLRVNSLFATRPQQLASITTLPSSRLAPIQHRAIIPLPPPTKS